MMDSIVKASNKMLAFIASFPRHLARDKLSNHLTKCIAMQIKPPKLEQLFHILKLKRVLWFSDRTSLN